MKRPLIPTIVITLAIAVAAFQLGRRTQPTNAKPTEDRHEAHIEGEKKEGLALSDESRKLAGIQTVEVRYAPVRSVVQATGEVELNANLLVKVGSFVAGRITQLTVGIGDEVKADQVLATVDSTEVAQARAGHQQAQTELANAQRKLANTQRLAQSGVFTQKSVDEVHEKRNEAASQLATLRVEYESEQGNAEAGVKTAQAAFDRAENARKLAEQELQRRKALIAAGAVQYKPLEDARREMAEAEKSARQARTQLRLAESNLTRTNALFDDGTRSKREVEEAEAARDGADAELRKSDEQVRIARQALTREQRVFDERIYVARELQLAETDLAQAEKVKTETEAWFAQAKRRLALAQSPEKKRALDEMGNRLAALESLLKRETSVAGQNLYAQKEVQSAEADVAQARAKLQAAENTLKVLRAASSGITASVPVVAPFSGRILERPVNRGQMVKPEDTLFTILDLSSVWVDARVFEKDLRQIRAGQPVEVRATSYPDQVFVGKVTYVSDTLDPKTGRTLTVRCEVPNARRLLRPEMSVRVTIVAGERRSLVAPLAAVREEGGQWIVHVANVDGRFTDRVIEKGVTDREHVEILKGLKPGEKVVTEGTFLLKSEEKKSEFESHGEEGH